MYTIGLNSCIVDGNNKIKEVDGGGVCLFKDDQIISAITEERLTYKKYDGGFSKGINYVLEAAHLTKKDVDQYAISFYGVSTDVPKPLVQYMEKQLNVEDYQKLIIIPTHHLSHAYFSYFTSHFNKSIIMVNDNEGQVLGEKRSPHMFENSCERTSFYLAEENKITLIDRDFAYPHALGFGKLYNKCTKYLGLGNYHNAGKTMGLASYSNGKFKDIGDVYKVDYDGNIHCIIDDSGNSEYDIQLLFNKLNVTVPRPREKNDPLTQIHAEIAGYIQFQLEKWSNFKLNQLIEQYDVNNVCTSGGVALNCLMNTSIYNNENVQDVHVPSAPQDQGLCIGNAIYAINEIQARDIKTKNNYSIPLFLGKNYRVNEQFLNVIFQNYENIRFRKLEEKTKETVNLLRQGNIIAWYQKGSEFGPRALGNRSILADPSDKFMVDRININIKKRETFRPFAPTVLEDKTRDYFEETKIKSPSMMFTAKVNNNSKHRLFSVTHVDGTARLQTLKREDNELYYDLIKEFGDRTGIYALLDTSFNLNAMPIVETPEDAINCYLNSNIDLLILEDYLIYGE